MTDALARALVNEDVPSMLRTLLAATNGASPVGDHITAQLTTLRSRGWHVEELQGRPGFDVCTDDRRRLETWIMPIPPHRNHEVGLVGDYMTGAMYDSWCMWSMWTWAEFGKPRWNDKDWFQGITHPWFFRAFTPAADRIYDIIIFRPGDPTRASIMPEEAFARGVEGFRRAIDAPDPQEFTHVFDPFVGSVRSVERIASRSSSGPYAALQGYAKVFEAEGSFLHAYYGKRRTRDGYVLALLAPHELVFVKTTPFSDITREALADDLRAILGVVPERNSGRFLRSATPPRYVALRSP
jgi:hypothetical protein